MYRDEIIYLLTTLMTPVLLLYAFVIVLTYGKRYLKSNHWNKVLQFTQGEVKDKQREINSLEDSLLMSEENKFWHTSQTSEVVLRIFTLYNELAVGIGTGLYDEDYVRMVMGYDMKMFYKENYAIIHETTADKFPTRFITLELLLKDWDEKEAPTLDRKYRMRRTH